MEFETTDVVLDSSVANAESVVNRDAPSFTLLPPIENVVGMSIISCQVPFSYYVIDYTNNQFIITITGATDGGGGTNYNGTVYTVTVPIGTYTSTNLPSMLNYCMETSSQITKTGGAGSAVDLGSVIDMKTLIDNTTSQVLFYVNNTTYSNDCPFTISFPTASIADVIGFTGVTSKASSSGTVYDNSDLVLAGGATNYLYSTYSVQLSGAPYLYLHSNLASTAFNAVRNSTNAQDIVAAIPVNNNYQGTIEYLNPFPQKITFDRTTINNLNFYWTLGNRTIFNTTSSSTSNIKYMELQGQPFFMVVRLYRMASTQNSMVLNSMGDKYTSADSTLTGSKKPNERVYGSREVSQSGPMYKAPKQDPTSSYPTPAPSRKPSISRMR
jgi:hypothetical protein